MEVIPVGHRKTYKEVDFTDLNDIILYAYGRERNIRSRKSIETLFLAVKERIYKDNVDNFRDKHKCKDCYLFDNKECKADMFCRFDKPRHRFRKKVVIGCPKNNNKPCCYANESGRCFGCCYKEAGITAGGNHTKEEREK